MTGNDGNQQAQGKLALIYARSRNHCIGKAGRIPWRLPADFAHFKQTTMGKPIIMGRKTYEDHESALPGRLNIVVSRQAGYKAAPGIVMAASLHEALEFAWQQSELVFVIGGVHFFVDALPRADLVYETVVNCEVDGDSVLPAFDFTDWQTQTLHQHAADERHTFAFTVFKHTRAQAVEDN